MKNDPQNILRAWTAIEVLSPHIYKKPENLANEEKNKVSYLNNGRWQWELGEEESPPNKRLYYQLVLGSIKMENATQALLRIYSDTRVEPPNIKGEAIIASIMMNKSGSLVEKDPISISSFAWGLPIALNGDLKALNLWPTVEKELAEGLHDVLRQNSSQGEQENLHLSAEGISSGFDWLLKKLGLDEAMIKSPSFAVKTYQYVKNQNPPDALLLNSFYLPDLAKAGQLFKNNKAPANLRKFLGVNKPQVRHDLISNQRMLADVLQPKNFPLAAWPAKGRFPLVLLQQCAVNLALGIKTNGMLAVNGPPGTGKTTLLRDVVAGILADRADIMATYDDPEAAFNKVDQVKLGQSFVGLFEIDEKLRSHEIIVASSNNKAVENVTAELPGIETICEESSELRYFKTASDNLLGRETWGIIAGVLGNAENRYKFQQNFWWHSDYGLQKYLQHASGKQQLISDSDKFDTNQLPTIIERENPPNDHDDAISRWQLARETYKNARDTIQKAMQDLQRIYEMQLEIAKNEEQLISSASRLQEHTDAKDEIQKNLAKAETISVFKRRAFDGQKARYNFAMAERPSFLNRLFRTAKHKNWINRHQTAIEAFRVAKKEWKNAEAELALMKEGLKDAERVVALLKDEIIELKEIIKLFKEDLNNIDSRCSGCYLDGAFFKLSHKEKQLASPWIGATLLKLRHDVFEAAIALHKAFVDAAAKPIRQNLNVLMDGFGMASLGDEKKDEAIPHLWATLFLLVPVISTTFASVGRMFRNIEPENLGWLLIDEAGQASPQQAVGALMRTKKSVIVGDPMQVEPVVLLPESLTNSICGHFDVDPLCYNAPQVSAQTLADAAGTYCAVFENDQGTREVGVPLLVHRRCSSPMFNISNKIAYGCMMVPAKIARDSPIAKVLGESCWINVQGRSNDKWCEEEGGHVIHMLEQLKTNGCEPDLYIVTPFRLVQDRLRLLIRNSKLLHGWVENPYQWPYERIGTIHTIQGREAEAVIFVLGAPNIEQQGARAWAGKPPNLMNVAITRAKEVLYVIGNKELWKTAGYFQELVKMLPDNARVS